MTKDKQFYTSFFSLCFTLMLQNIIVISINLADNVMLGGYSELALSGAAAVNQIQFVYQQLLTAAGEGVVIIGSQYLGKGQTAPMKQIAAIALKTGLVIGAVLFALVSCLPYPIVHLFTDNEKIIAEGVRYLRILRFSYLFFAVTMVMEASLRCAKMVKIALWLSVVTFFVNCSINYVLIYGRFGFPAMGIEGAAIGTLTARVVECAAVLAYARRKDHEVQFHLSDFLGSHRLLRTDYFRTVSAMMVVQGLWGLNNAVQTMILGHMNDYAIAASSVSSTLYMLLKSMAVGAASAAAVLIGRTVGEGRLQLTKEYARTMQVLFLGIGLFSGTLLFFLRVPVLGLYDLSGQTRELANTFLILQSVICVGMSYQMPVNNGIIRGGGSPQFVVKLDLISIWCIVIPVSLLMAFVVKAPPEVVFCCLNADQIFKCLPSGLKVNRGTWIRELTRDVAIDPERC